MVGTSSQLSSDRFFESVEIYRQRSHQGGLLRPSWIAFLLVSKTKLCVTPISTGDFVCDHFCSIFWIIKEVKRLEYFTGAYEHSIITLSSRRSHCGSGNKYRPIKENCLTPTETEGALNNSFCCANEEVYFSTIRQLCPRCIKKFMHQTHERYFDCVRKMRITQKRKPPS